jgi:hypothetical protein
MISSKKRGCRNYLTKYIGIIITDLFFKHSVHKHYEILNLGLQDDSYDYVSFTGKNWRK